MNGEWSILKLVAGRLDGAGIPYMVTGSVAAAFYAQPRMTRDIDLVVELEASGSARVIGLFAADFLMDEAGLPREVRRRGMFNLLHIETSVKVDFMVRKDTAYRREEFGRRRGAELDGQRIWMAAPEDLILSKLAWGQDSGSEVQMRDVQALLRAAPPLDEAYLARWAAELGVADLLQEARR